MRSLQTLFSFFRRGSLPQKDVWPFIPYRFNIDWYAPASAEGIVTVSAVAFVRKSSLKPVKV